VSLFFGGEKGYSFFNNLSLLPFSYNQQDLQFLTQMLNAKVRSESAYEMIPGEKLEAHGRDRESVTYRSTSDMVGVGGRDLYSKNRLTLSP